jgi:hypothetical protein
MAALDFASLRECGMLWVALILLAAISAVALSVGRRRINEVDLGAVSDRWISHHRGQRQ